MKLRDGVSIQECKRKALVEAAPPSSPSELRRILCLANYCSHFIVDLATLVEPLRKLTDNKVKWLNSRRLNSRLCRILLFIFFWPYKAVFILTIETFVEKDSLHESYTCRETNCGRVVRVSVDDNIVAWTRSACNIFTHVPSPKRPASLVRVSTRMSSTCIRSRTRDAQLSHIYNIVLLEYSFSY